MQIWNQIKPYFLFTKKEKRGVIVLLILIVISLTIRIVLPTIPFMDKSANIELDYIKIKRNQEEKKSVGKPENKTSRKRVYEIKPVIKPDYFDPNTSSYNDLVSVGFSKRISSNIVKFRESGGLIRNQTDLYKIYGVDSSYVDLISKYCIINSDNIQQVERRRDLFRKSLIVELNEADSADLTQLPGIGKVLSQRILRYRSMLGGFVCKEQLMEIYGIKNDNYEIFASLVSIDTCKIIQININEASEKVLSKHPYLNNYQSRAMVKYRELVGDFSNSKELLDNYILTEEEFSKVEPYLCTN